MSEPQKKSLYYPGLITHADKRYLGCFDGIEYFQNDLPSGITIHYTASINLSATINSLQEKNLGYHFIIGRDGIIYQCCDIRFQLYHAGNARWQGESPNKNHIAIALLSWGHVERYTEKHLKTWAGNLIPIGDCIYDQGKWWHKSTRKQRAGVTSVLNELSFIDSSKICGHDECCIPAGRKLDPGGVLNVSYIRQSYSLYAISAN